MLLSLLLSLAGASEVAIITASAYQIETHIYSYTMVDDLIKLNANSSLPAPYVTDSNAGALGEHLTFIQSNTPAGSLVFFMGTHSLSSFSTYASTIQSTLSGYTFQTSWSKQVSTTEIAAYTFLAYNYVEHNSTFSASDFTPVAFSLPDGMGYATMPTTGSMSYNTTNVTIGATSYPIFALGYDDFGFEAMMNSVNAYFNNNYMANNSDVVTACCNNESSITGQSYTNPCTGTSSTDSVSVNDCNGTYGDPAVDFTYTCSISVTADTILDIDMCSTAIRLNYADVDTCMDLYCTFGGATMPPRAQNMYAAGCFKDTVQKLGYNSTFTFGEFVASVGNNETFKTINNATFNHMASWQYTYLYYGLDLLDSATFNTDTNVSGVDTHSSLGFFLDSYAYNTDNGSDGVSAWLIIGVGIGAFIIFAAAGAAIAVYIKKDSSMAFSESGLASRF